MSLVNAVGQYSICVTYIPACEYALPYLHACIHILIACMQTYACTDMHACMYAYAYVHRLILSVRPSVCLCARVCAKTQTQQEVRHCVWNLVFA